MSDNRAFPTGVLGVGNQPLSAFTSAQADEKSFLVVNTDNNEDTDLGNNRRIQLTSTQLAAVDGGAAGDYTVSFADPVTSLNIQDTGLVFEASGNNTKKARFNCSGITAGQTRIISFPDAGGSAMVLEDNTATLTNKTIDSSTNTVTADNLHSATTTIDVSSATAPTVGQYLIATSDTTATWQTPTTNTAGCFVSKSTTLGDQTLSHATLTRVEFDVVDTFTHNVDGNFSTANDYYTVPADGVYIVSAAIQESWTC